MLADWKNAMKILLISPLPPPVGGIAAWTEYTTGWLTRHGWEVCVVNTALVGSRSGGSRKIRVWEELGRTLTILRKTRQAMKREAFDAIHINASCARLGLMRDMLCLAMAGKRKTVLHCHCNIADQLGHSRLSARLFSWGVRRASRVLVLNRDSYDRAVAAGGKHVELLPNFLVRDMPMEDTAVKQTMQKVLFVGSVHRDKGVFEIIEAARALPDLEFILIGAPDREVTEMRLPGNVKLAGVKEGQEIPALLAQGDVFLFPSHTEGFSMALLEAMAAGLPVVATGVGANGDMLENGGGILVPVGDSAAIVRALNGLDPESRAEMSRRNRTAVEKNYLPDTVLSKLVEIYKSL